MVLTFTDNDEKFLFAHDLNSIVEAMRGNGVFSGLVTTQRAAGANMSVDVSPGVYIANAVRRTKTAVVNVAITAADVTNPRFDIIQADSSGNVTVKTGTASPTPLVPSPDSNKIRLAIVQVSAGVTSITNAQITDARITLEPDILMKKGRGLFEDFKASSGHFSTATVTGGPTFTFGQTDTGNWTGGLLQISCGAFSEGTIRALDAFTGTGSLADGIIIDVVAKPNTIDADTRWFIGCADGNTDLGNGNPVANTDAFGFWSHSNTTYIVSQTSNAARTTTTITPSAGVYHHFRIVATATQIDFYLDGVSQGSITTNLASGDMTFVVGLWSGSGTKTMNVGKVWTYSEF